MVRIICIFIFMFLDISHTNELSAEFISSAEYKNKGSPCACPDDRKKNGVKCGDQSALCRNGGFNISDCGTNIVTSVDEYQLVKSSLCKKHY